MKKIVKFGGSSLANAQQFEKVGEIIRSERDLTEIPKLPIYFINAITSQYRAKISDLFYRRSKRDTTRSSVA